MEHQILASLADDQRRAVLAATTRRRFRRRDTLFHEYDLGDTLHLLVRGRVAVRTSTPLGDVVTLRVLGPGSSFGELALFDPDRRRTASVVALDGVETLTLHHRDFEALCADQPEVWRLLVGLLARRVDDLSKMLVDALHSPADDRVVLRLADLVDVFATDDDGPVEIGVTTLLQRWCREAALARVYGLNDSVTAGTEIIGAIAAPVLVATVGLDLSLGVVGLIVAGGAALLGPVLHREAQASEARRIALLPIVGELAAMGLFEGASRAGLERIASAVRDVELAAGTEVFAEGDPADDLYLVRSGAFVATSKTVGTLSTMEHGDWFGEIGVLGQRARTASVHARTDAMAWAVDGSIFAAAVAGPLQTRGLLRGTLDARLARTHPADVDTVV